jgi:hypothetical protein
MSRGRRLPLAGLARSLSPCLRASGSDSSLGVVQRSPSSTSHPSVHSRGPRRERRCSLRPGDAISRLVPSLPFLPTSTVCSARVPQECCILQPTMGFTSFRTALRSLRRPRPTWRARLHRWRSACRGQPRSLERRSATPRCRGPVLLGYRRNRRSPRHPGLWVHAPKRAFHRSILWGVPWAFRPSGAILLGV